MRSITLRTLAQATTCAAIGVTFAAGCIYAASTTPMPVVGEMEAIPSLGIHLTSEQIDVLTEGEDYDHPWEQCRITGVVITCPDGWTGEYAAPEDDGSLFAAGSYRAQADLTPCAGVDREPHLPCRVLMRPTYVVGGDGVRHEQCSITLVNHEDSQMVCADDTVWAS